MSEQRIPLLWYSAESAAEALDMRRLGFEHPAETLKRMASEGRIPSGNWGGRVVFFPEHLMTIAAEVRTEADRKWRECKARRQSRAATELAGAGKAGQ